MKAVLAALSAGAIVMAAAPAFAGDQDFTIINKSGMSFKEVYVEAHSAEEWGDNLIEEPLKSGETFDVEFEGYGKECKFDFLVVGPDDTEYTIENVNLCETNEVVFTKKGKDLYWKAK